MFGHKNRRLSYRGMLRFSNFHSIIDLWMVGISAGRLAPSFSLVPPHPQKALHYVGAWQSLPWRWGLTATLIKGSMHPWFPTMKGQSIRNREKAVRHGRPLDFPS